jgi:hypothetical protein
MANWRRYLFRRLLGRFQIRESIVRHLTTFQRLGQAFEIEPPGEMLPVGARNVFRAVRTSGAVQLKPGWRWPYWMRRQLDPRDVSFVPRGHLPFLTNVTYRNWTMVGGLGSPWEAIVDPRGLVTPWFDGWSLDWGHVEEGRWVHPADPSEVRQQLELLPPVVRTELPIPGGILIHRAYGLSEPSEAVVVELENASDRTVDAGLVLRPHNPEGLAVVERVELRSEEVLVDGHPAVALPRRPDRVALSGFSGPDAVDAVLDGTAPGADAVEDPVGLGQAAFVYVLGPRERIRCALYREPQDGDRRRSRRHPRIDAVDLPGPETEAPAWEAALGRGMRVRLPDPELQRAVEANLAFGLLLHDGDSITPGPFTYHRFWFRDAAFQLAALDRWGFHGEAGQVIDSFPDRQRGDGFFYSQWREWDSNGAALWTIAEHHRLARDHDLLARVAPSMRRGVAWIQRALRRHAAAAPDAEGLLPPGVSAEHFGPFDYYYWDDFWAWRGLLDAARIFLELGDVRWARHAADVAEGLQKAVLRSITDAALRVRRPVIPAGPTRGIDAAMVGSLAACSPLELFSPGDPLIEGTLRELDRRFCVGEALFHNISHTGLGTYLTMQLAHVELERGDLRGWRRLRWLLDAASPTFAWPEAIHPQTGGGCMGDGHHGWAAADFLIFVRNLLVRDLRDGSVGVLSLLPDEWRGSEVVVEDAPTRRGRLSYRLTWTEEGSSSLEWELEGDATLRAPGVDPGWSTDEPRGRVTLPIRADGRAAALGEET